LLVRHKVLAGQDEHPDAGKGGRHATPPRLTEIHAINVRDDVAPDRRNADLEDGPEVVQRGAEGHERLYRAGGVRLVRANPDIEVLRRADVAMRRERVGADHEILNAVRVERG